MAIRRYKAEVGTVQGSEGVGHAAVLLDQGARETYHYRCTISDNNEDGKYWEVDYRVTVRETGGAAAKPSVRGRNWFAKYIRRNLRYTGFFHLRGGPVSAEFDLIFGLHSIAAALKNPRRSHIKLVATDEGLSELQKKHRIVPKNYNVKTDILSSHALQEQAKKLCQHLDLDFTRVPSGIYLQTSVLETYTIQEFLKNPDARLVALDQITDVHNGAAILRSACFYGLTGVLVPSEKSFGLTPSFYRIASGAVEHVPLIRVSSLSRAVGLMNDAGFLTVGLSEHASENFGATELRLKKKICLLLGAEETGLSNAVARLVQKNLSLTSRGEIKSLNVSSAAAIAMEKCFGI